ncbi:MAG TPA: ECF-type sigma factor [Gemmata sp.]|jgi:RNA polymerase sigma factor (TIGR02999 family)|nr:ECF-type sigma factor [Gemmata sp.]
MTETSQILLAIEGGDPQAASKLLPLVYNELRQLAAQRLAREKSGQTLDATSLVHEAYVRLVGDNPERPWNGRGHFFAAASEAMRRILIEKARRKRRIRHGGDKQRHSLSEAQLADEAADDKLLAVDEALDVLAREDQVVAEVVKLRFFVGLTIEKTADVLNISVRTVNRHWSYARAWLYQQLKSSANPSISNAFSDKE